MRTPPPVVTDLGLGVGVTVLLLAAAWTGVGPTGLPDARPADLMAVGLAGVLAAALGTRRRYPFTTLIVLNAATLAWLLAGYPGRLVTIVPMIGLFTIAAHRGWRWGLAAAGVCALGMVLIDRTTGLTVIGESPPNPELVLTAYLAGVAMHYRRERDAAIHRRHATEQRLRIAREVHDSVGHTMATISVQAGVAIHVLDRRPGQAGEALTAIKKISDDGLADLKSIVTTLHTGEPAPPTGLDQLTPLLDATTAAGPRVELTVHGTRRPLPAEVDRAAYRIIQESLTNVLRHAGATTVQLDLDYRPTHLAIRVRDNGTGRVGPSVAGHGIAGMRHRATAVSGQFTAGPRPTGGFEVHCELPTMDTP